MSKHPHAPQGDFDLSAYLERTTASSRLQPKTLVLQTYGALDPAFFDDWLHPGDQEDERARRAIAAAGLPGDPYVRVNPSHALLPRNARGIPWTAFPVLSAPHLALARPRHMENEVKLCGPGEPGDQGQHMFTHELADTITHVVVVRDKAWSRRAAWHYDAVEYLRKVFGDRIPAISLVEREAARRMPLEELRAEGAADAPRRRFQYCYRINMKAIARKPLLLALAERPDGWLDRGARLVGVHPETVQWALHASRNIDGSRLMEGMSDPLALQVMYAVRAGGGVGFDGRDLRSGEGRPLFTQPFHYALAELMARRFQRRVEWIGDGDEAHALWTGTGRHAPVPIARQPLTEAMYQLVLYGLVEHRDHRIGLSRAGEIFLDMLHPDCEDPDLPCRWHGMPPEEAGPKMDAWILRFFRKMKTRVNALPDA